MTKQHHYQQRFLVGLFGLFFVGCSGDAELSEDDSVWAGFKAKLLCSSVFVSGRSPDEVLTHDLPGLEYLPYEVDEQTGSVHVAEPPRVAIYEGPRKGCTLLPPGHVATGVPRADPPIPNRTGLWPEGPDPLDERPAGIDDALLDATVAAAFENPAGGHHTQAVVVVHRGRIIAERYADSVGRDTPLLGWSMTKSVTSALIGTLERDGRLSLAEDRLFAEWDGDGRRDIRLADVLRMSSGLDWDETYVPGSDAANLLFEEADAAAYAASRPLLVEPGTRFNYSSGDTMLLSRLLRDRLDSDEYEMFAERALFGPLGMDSALIERDANGNLLGAAFMYATAQDWARFGLLHLRGGDWFGQRILPAEWVDFARTPAPGADVGQYGGQFWLAPKNDGPTGLPDDLFWAEGYRGQFILMVPSLELMVVRLGQNYTADAWSPLELLSGVMRSVEEAHPAAD